jgi:glycosyltransferase involved in cell wall biosynthesis
MRVLYVITGLGTGGAEAMLLKLLERLNRERYTPMVISLTTIGEIGPRIVALGIQVQALGMTFGFPSPWSFLSLIRHINQFKPDIVHTWLYHADLLGGVAAWLAGAPAIAWNLRNSNLERDKTRWSTRLVVHVCAAISHWVPKQILSCSETARRVHVELGYSAGKMVVIPNGFDLARFRSDEESRRTVRKELQLSYNAKLVGLMARFDPHKNHRGFVEAAAAIHKAMPEVHFVLAGSGVDEANVALNDLVDANDLTDCIHLLGLRNDMPRLMAALDVLASSSYGEAFPNVLGEAMACGVPCVVTDVGDSAEIVGETGRVVQPGDMQGLAQHIVELLHLPKEGKRELGLKARARVDMYYEISFVTRRYEAFYEQLS